MFEAEKRAKIENEANMLAGTIGGIYGLGMIVYVVAFGSFCGALVWPLMLVAMLM